MVAELVPEKDVDRLTQPEDHISTKMIGNDTLLMISCSAAKTLFSNKNTLSNTMACSSHIMLKQTPGQVVKASPYQTNLGNSQ